MSTLYGIPNCDTVRKARKWLAAQGQDVAFHDFRKDGLEAKQVRAWAKGAGWEKLLNRRGTSWRQLPEDVRAAIDEASAIRLMIENPTLIKRPVLEHQGTVEVGFSEQRYEELFA